MSRNPEACRVYCRDVRVRVVHSPAFALIESQASEYTVHTESPRTFRGSFSGMLGTRQRRTPWRTLGSARGVEWHIKRGT